MKSRPHGDPFRHKLIALNVLSVLLFSPNFASVVYPALKGLQLALFLLTAAYLVATAAWRIDRLTVIFLLFLVCLVSSATVNYLRFVNPESLYLTLSYLVKALSVVMLFQLCRTPLDLHRMLKLCVVVLVSYALHGIVQFVVVALGLVAEQGSIELLGYEFVNIGWAGIYRVAFPIGDFNLIRVQSFFQEPGFFAFYLLFGLILMDHVRARMPFAHARLCAGIILVAMLLTFSLTGIVLMMAYLVIKTRSWLFRGIAVAVVLIALDFIVFNENELIAKTGSLDMRLEHYALLETIFSSWQNIVFGIGFGNEALISEMRVNNFIPELLMYSSVFGLLVMLVLLATALKRGHRTNHIMLMVALYSLSTPMFWSPVFLIAIFMSWRVPRTVGVSSPPRAPPGARALAPLSV
jgi:hypothetical protein